MLKQRDFRFCLKCKRLTGNEQNKYRAIVNLINGKYTMDEDILISSLQTLSQLLCQHYGQKAIILIDEYDVPLDKAFQHGYYKEMISLIRMMFGKALKTNDALAFAVLTGCLRVSKESIFTGLNNFKILSITDTRFDEQFGFTDTEVKKLLSDYQLGERFPEVKDWYDGYRFGKADVYCPWDVINFVDRAKDDPVSGIVAELKYTKDFGEMEAACQKALQQIKDRRYQEYLLNDDRKDYSTLWHCFLRKKMPGDL